MATTTIVEDFDEVEHSKARLTVGGEEAAIDELAFQGSKEAFARSVVVTVSHGAHGGCDAGFSEATPEGERGVLRPLVRVMDQTGLRTPTLDRRLEGVADQLGRKIVPHRPPDYGPAEHVEHHREVQ